MINFIIVVYYILFWLFFSSKCNIGSEKNILITKLKSRDWNSWHNYMIFYIQPCSICFQVNTNIHSFTQFHYFICKPLISKWLLQITILFEGYNFFEKITYHSIWHWTFTLKLGKYVYQTILIFNRVLLIKI